MFTEEQRERISAAVRTLQIIVSALVLGVLAFLGVVLAIRRGADPAEPFLSYVAAALAVASAIASALVPSLVASQAIRADKLELALDGAGRVADTFDDLLLSQLLASFQTRMIIASALLEGAAFFNLVAYLIEGQTLSLIVTGVLLAMMAMRFPTTGSALDWIARVCGRRQ